ncbi:hypothetical protein BHM03_00054635 [Ensete ventricosum]|uniref:Uncharacterized protein n=1 Tax=Ensete ventricosum TaxID=4639 RepID=A0A445MM66_ENSVE|nr:hypothetical protein BHM03_00054635 [Ensete ventricosum]
MLSTQLTWALLQVEEAEQCFVEAHKRAEVETFELLSGEAIEDGKQLKEQLLTNFDELVATHLATEEVKRVWEEEKNQASSSLAMLHTS